MSESQNDWVTQDRALPRPDDEYRWVWGQRTPSDWLRIGTFGFGKMHGYVDVANDRFELRCRRKDLPPLPETQSPSGIEAIVCQDITERQKLGIAKYGKTVADNPLSLREWLQHAYQECLDQAVYLRKAMEECG